MLIYHRTSVIVIVNSHRIRNLSKTTSSGRSNSIYAQLSPPCRHVHATSIDLLIQLWLDSVCNRHLPKANVSGYVCNHGSPSGERDTASPRGRYGERPQRDSVWRYICKNTTCWPATAHDVTTGVPQYKCRREIHHQLLRLKLASEAWPKA